MTEVAFNPVSMSMYTDHRVMGRIVLPGVSHVSLMAAAALLGFANQNNGGFGGRPEDESAVIKDVLFERPYVVHDGRIIIHGPNALDEEDPMVTNTREIVTYCRATSVAREFISSKI